MNGLKNLLIAAGILAMTQLAACTITPPNATYAERTPRCEKQLGSLVCGNDEANPEAGNGLSAPGVLNNIQGLPGGGR